MTTTIYDKLNKQVASDTRWSSYITLSDGKLYFVYIDNCSFEKIANKDHVVLVLAGNGELIAQWKEWWYNGMDLENLPPIDIDGKTVVSLMIVDKVNNDILFDTGEKKNVYCEDTKLVLSVFSGSGSIHAADCWDRNRCVKKAIITASNEDYFTSDSVKYVNFITGKSNLGVPNYNYDTIVNEMLDEGFIMDVRNSTAANDAGIRLNQHQIKDEVMELFANGKAVASAPFSDISEFKWNKTNKAKLVTAIGKVKQLEELV